MASPWREQLSAASYKGVPFFVDSHTWKGGRRIVDHIFPYIDKAFTEDLGARQNVFDIEAFVLGEDYFAARDSLVKAVTSEGAGILVHPFLGEITVEAVEFSLTETSKEGGIARFSLTFHETSRQASANIEQDLVPLLEEASDEVDESLIESFAGFSIAGLTPKAVEDAIAQLTAVTEQLDKARAFVVSQDFGVAELAYSIMNLKASTRGLIKSPAIFARNTVDSMKLLMQATNTENIIPTDDDERELTRPDALADFIFRSKENRRAFLPLLAKVGDTAVNALIPGGIITPSKLLIRENERLVNLLMVGSAIAKYAVTAANSVYETLEDAVREREFIISVVGEILEDPKVSDRTFQAFQDLTSLVVEAIPSPFSQPKRISRITLYDATPSVVLAYDLYEDLSLEQDILFRNRVQNPSYIPAGQVEVISGG